MIDISSLAEKIINKEKNSKNNPTINRNNFKFLCVIGKGGFGRVWKIQSKKTKEIYALKEMSKLKIIDKKSEKSINSEREFLSKLNHPFIVNMHYAFQDKDNLYLVMDILSGGDLRYHVSRYRKFSEEQTRFFISNIIYALEYIHDNNVIHRDIKPENLVLDDKGYVRITDFGIAKENLPDNSSETSGTPGYMAPEVMKGKNHSFCVDFFAIGVIGYEFMLGQRPYYGKNRKEIKEQMLSKAVIINEENIMKGWSMESADFINLLLERKECKRLGYKGGAKELMKHPWLKYYPWDELKSKKLLAPFIPENEDNFDKNYCESIDKVSEETQLRYEEIYESSHFRKVFVDFYFNEEEKKLKIDEIDKIEKEKTINIKVNKIPKNSNNSNNNEYSSIKQKEETDENNNFFVNKNNENSIKIKETTNKFISNINNYNSCKNSSCNSKTKKIIYNHNNNSNNTNRSKKILKKNLSRSGSTKEISAVKYSSTATNFKKKLTHRNISKPKQLIHHDTTKKKFSHIPQPSSRGSSININNYYINNIFNAIYNNIEPLRQNYNKNSAKKKKISQRSSSVIAIKREGSAKIKPTKKKQKIEYRGENKNKGKYSVINSIIPNRKINKINSNSKLNTKKTTNEYILKKIKSISAYNPLEPMHFYK